MRKKAIGLLVIPALRLVASLCYDRRYLQGRMFKNSRTGWLLLLRCIWWQKLLGINRHIPWPTSPFVRISDPKRISFDPEWWDIFQGFGSDFQNFVGHITIGTGTYIAANVTILTANHDPMNPDVHLPPEDVTIGRNCWLGTRSVVLPGVTLGDHTVVGAGAVVTKSYPEGYCILGGVPARPIRHLRRAFLQV